MANKAIKEILKKNEDRKVLLIEQYKKENDLEKKLQILYDLADSMSYQGIGKFSSKMIEAELLDVANKFEVELSTTYKSNHFLHVFTETYNIGGHTRVCERWIKNSPDSEIHSILILGQSKKEEIPKRLEQEVCKKNGEFIVFEKNDSFVNRALELRKIASSYDKIILHVHLQDIIPLIAFGNKNFTRPVILFDHGDHLFWLGVSISDLVVNLRTYTSNIAIKRRGVKKAAILPLPIEEPNKLSILSDEEKKRLKEELGFHADSKVILTMASPYKYLPFEKYDFVKTAIKILDGAPNSYLLAIGPSLKDHNPKWEKYWNDAVASSKGRIKPIGYINNDEVEKYIQISDLALDSFPFGSSTGLMDIGKYNIPCLTLATPINPLDSFSEASIFCYGEKELIKKSVRVLLDKAAAPQQTKFCAVIKEKHFPQAFTKNLQKIYQQCPKFHTINDFKEDKQKKVSAFEIFSLKLFFYNDNMPDPRNKKNFLVKRVSKFKKSFKKRLHYIKKIWK